MIVKSWLKENVRLYIFHTNIYQFEIQYFLAPNKNEFNSIQEAIGPILVFSQFFGIFPVIGITSKNVKDLKFKWTAARTIYSIVLLIFGFAELVLMVVRVFRKGFKLKYAGLYKLIWLNLFNVCNLYNFMYK